MRIFCTSTFGVASLVVLSPFLRAETLAGKVIGPDGKPVVATVYFVANSPWDSAQKQVQSAADGTFRFEVEAPKTPAKAVKTPVLPGKVSGNVAVYAPGFSLGTAILNAEADNTVKLAAPRTIGGILRDDKGAPVAGASLRVSWLFQDFGSGSRQNRQPFFFKLPESLLPAFTTRTDDKGAWKIVGVPIQATVHVELDDDDYVNESAQFNDEGERSGPGKRGLVARRAGSISGRVVDSKGAPAPGVSVVANPTPGQSNARHMGGFAKTGADGTFRITRVYAGTYTLLTRDLAAMSRYGADGERLPAPSSSLVAPALENVRVESGKTAANNAFRLVIPAIVKGRILDKEGKPLSEVSVGAFGKSAPRAAGVLPATLTDKEGRFEMALVPGANAIYAFEADRWGNDTPDQPVSLPVTLRAGANPVASLRVERRFADWQGQIVDEAGAPAANVEITVWNNKGTGQTLLSDAAGRFVLKRMNIGSLRLDPRHEWTVISPKKVSLPATSPAKIVVRRNAMARVTVRVVDAAGKPVEGVKMRFTMPLETSEGQNARSVFSPVSDAAGEHVFEALKMPEALQLKLENASRKGYKWRNGASAATDAKVEDKSFALADIVMERLGSNLQGIVKAENGAPIEGALVRSSGDGFETEAKSDAAGRWELADQPAGEVELVAAHGRSFGRATINGGNAEIVLLPIAAAPAQNVERAVALFREMAPSANGRTLNEAIEVLAPHQPATALELLLAAPQSQPDKARLRIIETLPPGSSEETLAWAQRELLQIASDADFVRAGARLGLLLAARQPDAARRVFALVDERRAKLSGNAAMIGAAWTAGLAARLELPVAPRVFDQALAPALRSPAELKSIVAPLSAGTLALAEAILEELPPGQESNIYLYRQAIEEVARYDVVGAQRLLERMRVLVDAVPQRPTENGQYRGRDALEFDWAFAAKDVMRALPRSEAAAATQIARRVQGWHRTSALAMAAEFGTREERLAMVGETAQAETRGDWMKNITLPRLGALAAGLDETTAAQLFAQSAQSIEEQRRDHGDNAATDWSFYAAFWNPASARLALEADWTRLQQKSRQSEPDPHNSMAWNGASLSMAMSAINLDRALEWARTLSDKSSPNNSSPRARALQFIGELLLQDPDKRRLMVIGGESGFDN